MIDIRRASTADDVAAVKSLFLDYLAFIEDYLGQTLGFQGTQAEMATFPDIYDALFLARLDGKAVAACAIKPFKDDICELKRLYCRVEGRGHGLGLKLTQACITEARAQNYATMYLDTDPGLTHANQIYEALGFRDIARYYDNPMDSRFMALTL